MNTPPLCIIQARYHSVRFPGKMIATLGGETLIERAHRLAVDAFGTRNVVVAIPSTDDDTPLRAELDRIGATVFSWFGDETDVLGRFYHCAGRYRWNPQSVIARWTPDDPFKEPDLCQRVAAGERFPVEQSCEAFTMATLARAQHTTALEDPAREHLGIHRVLIPFAPPPCPDGAWTIDTAEDLAACEQALAADDHHTAQLWAERCSF